MFRKFLTIFVIVTGLFITARGILRSAQTDNIEISVIPTFTYAITISTGDDAGVNFGNMAPNVVQISSATSSAYGPTTATIYNSGNITADWQVSCQALTKWDLMRRSGGNKDTVAMDSATISLILTPAATCAINITDSEFQDNDMIDTMGNWYEMNQSSFTHYSGAATAANNPDCGNNVAAGSARQLYLRMKAPSDTSVTTQQRYRIMIRAVPSATF